MGITYQSNYNQNGLILGLSSGYGTYHWDLNGGLDWYRDDFVYSNLSLAYQWRLLNYSSYIYFSLGLQCTVSLNDIMNMNKNTDLANNGMGWFPVGLIFSLEHRF